MAEGGITAGVTVHTMLTHMVQLRLRAITHGAKPKLGATDDRGGYQLSRCHNPLVRVLQVFTDKAF